jgi:hypothetical protein
MSGGVAIGGSAGVTASLPQTYAYEVSGGFTVGGAADTGLSSGFTYTYAADGGCVIGGEATTDVVRQDRAPAIAAGGGGLVHYDGYVVIPNRPAKPKPTVFSHVARGGVWVDGRAEVRSAYRPSPVAKTEWLAAPGVSRRAHLTPSVTVTGKARVSGGYAVVALPVPVVAGGRAKASMAYSCLSNYQSISVGGEGEARYVEDLAEILLLAA